ncbi:MAG: 50S ribosomal protein L11 methyltransferase [Verrucomicrobia bacterium]|nr:50S ribosomal protein L11 methyltransferase [Verrucomicrobiota bacterium]
MFRWSREVEGDEEEHWASLLELAEVFACFHQLPGRDEVRIEAFVQDEEQARRMLELWGGEVVEIGDQDWVAVAAREWLGYVLPIRDRFVLTLDERPEFVDALRVAHPDRELLVFPPGLAFGTGDHATTATCLDLLAAEAESGGVEGREVLDLGCGTGILGIAAAKLGATRVDGLDNDPLAVAAAIRYWKDNGSPGGEGVAWAEADVLLWEPDQEYDLVLGNLFSDILRAAMPKIRRAVRPEGTVILSGILAEQSGGVIESAMASGLRMVSRVDVGPWTTLRLVVEPRA